MALDRIAHARPIALSHVLIHQSKYNKGRQNKVFIITSTWPISFSANYPENVNGKSTIFLPLPSFLQQADDYTTLATNRRNLSILLLQKPELKRNFEEAFTKLPFTTPTHLNYI